MKKYLLTGLISLLPLALTIMIVIWLFDFFTTPFVGIVESIFFHTNHGIPEHETLILFLSRVIALVLLFFLILILGFFGRRFFFKFFMRLTNQLFLRIPIVKSIYRISHEITNAVFSQKEKTFTQTVLIPFPTKETHALGLVTGGGIPPNLQKVIDQESLSVFVPTAPHPMSGYILFSPKKHVHPVDITVEDAFKFIVSCGMIHPGQEPPKEEKDE